MQRTLTISAVAATAIFLAACGSDSDSTDPGAQALAVTITDDGCSPPT